ncbi:MAG: hypothetical protein OEY60_16675, partial [Nitrospira sp.]|nr:hypothetical protein [Nitrospira sp.]
PAGDPERTAIAGADGLAAPEWNLRSRSRFLQANIGQAPSTNYPNGGVNYLLPFIGISAKLF